jgi:hypothetical protein
MRDLRAMVDYRRFSSICKLFILVSACRLENKRASTISIVKDDSSRILDFKAFRLMLN